MEPGEKQGCDSVTTEATVDPKGSLKLGWPCVSNLVTLLGPCTLIGHSVNAGCPWDEAWPWQGHSPEKDSALHPQQLTVLKAGIMRVSLLTS